MPGQTPNQYTETTKKGYGTRLMDSIKGILFGILLFAGAFVLLFWNEGRADLSILASTAVQTEAAQVDAALDGQLVAAAGTVKATGKVSEGKYLKPGDYLMVKRDAEMFAWIEESDSSSDTKVGGSEETTTTYTYKKGWTSSPADSSSFKIATGHENPNMSESAASFKAPGAVVGAYGLTISNLQLPSPEKIALNANNVFLSNGATLEGSEYIYIGSATFGSPKVGDARVSYRAVPAEVEGTVFGLASKGKIASYVDDEGTKLYRAFDRGFDASVAQLKTEHKTMTWILRAVGFLMMWIGLGAILAPFSVLLDVLPLLGHVSRTAVKLVTFVISIVLSLLTIWLSMLLHNIYAVGVVLAVLIIGIAIWFKSGKQKKA
jgi:hypothetical protein